jgi:hypothetical protein
VQKIVNAYETFEERRARPPADVPAEALST